MNNRITEVDGAHNSFILDQNLLAAYEAPKERRSTTPPETQIPLSLREQIEKRAYQIWIDNGGGRGNDLQHWFQAEQKFSKAVERRPHDSKDEP